jgi:putative ABC transport system ATP-binding protein
MSIRCKSLEIKFGSIVFLEETDLTIHDKSIVLLLGPSGSGKTTLFNIICRLIPALSDKTHIYWFDYQADDMKMANKERYKYISMIYSHFYFLQSLNVEDNIKLPAVFSKQPATEINKRLDMLYDIFSFDDHLKELSLKELSKRQIGPLSNGQKEMVGIARAFMNNAPFVFADELLRSYNREAETAIWEKLFSPEFGIGIDKGFFMITHKDHLKLDKRVDHVYSIQDKQLKDIKNEN